MDMSMSNASLDHDHGDAGSGSSDVEHYDDETFDATAELFKALSSPLRLAIVHAVHESPKCVHELVTELGVSQPLVSQHLRVLRAARVVHGERRGREITYLLTDHHIGHIVSDALAHTEEPSDD
jgi:ArsR family transcriptional regulator, zinc-responsive transcriptional repressor